MNCMTTLKTVKSQIPKELDASAANKQNSQIQN